MKSEIGAILKLEVPLIVRLGERQMTLEQVISLVPGAILELPKHADEELELLVNNMPLGLGIAVKVGENFGLRLSHVGDIKARIEALKGASTARPLSARAA